MHGAKEKTALHFGQRLLQYKTTIQLFCFTVNIITVVHIYCILQHFTVFTVKQSYSDHALHLL